MLKIIDVKAFLIAGIFTIIFTLWEVFFIKVPFLRYIYYSVENYSIKYNLFLLGVALVPLFLLFLFIYSIITSSAFVKITGSLFFTLILLFEYSHLRSVGRLSIPVDLEIGLFMVNAEQIQAAIASYANWWALLPGLLLAPLFFFTDPI
jgi:hypothetical protein